MNTWRIYWLNGAWTGKGFSESGCNISKYRPSRQEANGPATGAVEETGREPENSDKRKPIYSKNGVSFKNGTLGNAAAMLQTNFFRYCVVSCSAQACLEYPNQVCEGYRSQTDV